MALIKCRECGKEYSDIKEECFHCGFPRESLVLYDTKFKRSEKRTDFYNRWFKPQPLNRSSNIIRSISAIFLMIFLVAFVLALSTKPIRADFERHIKNSFKQAEAKEKRGRTELGKAWVNFKYWLGEGAMDAFSSGYYQDYHVFSYYILIIGDEQLEFLGIYGEVILVNRK
jgi:ribosomal protein L37E